RSGKGLSVYRMASQMVAALIGGAAIYSLALLALIDWIQPLVLGQAYAGPDGAVLAWSVVTVLLVARNGLTMAQEVMKFFQVLFVVNTIAGIIAVGLAILLATHFGAIGAIWALAGAEFLLCILLGRRLFGVT